MMLAKIRFEVSFFMLRKFDLRGWPWFHALMLRWNGL
jgi:hypothetical protein